jgi:hypothetical protein
MGLAVHSGGKTVNGEPEDIRLMRNPSASTGFTLLQVLVVALPLCVAQSAPAHNVEWGNTIEP